MTIDGRTPYPASDPALKKVWACLLTNESYLRGVLTLYYSLVRTGTKYPFYVIYTEVRYFCSEMLTADFGTEGIGYFEGTEYTYCADPVSSSWDDVFRDGVSIQ
jgi:hypothetical protein